MNQTTTHSSVKKSVSKYSDSEKSLSQTQSPFANKFYAKLTITKIRLPMTSENFDEEDSVTGYTNHRPEIPEGDRKPLPTMIEATAIRKDTAHCKDTARERVSGISG